MATTYVVDGGSAMAGEYFRMLTTKFPLKIYAHGKEDVISQIQTAIQGQHHRALLVVGLDEHLDRDLAISLAKIFENPMNVLVAVFFAERHKCPKGWDAFKSILDPQMQPRYLTGQE